MTYSITAVGINDSYVIARMFFQIVYWGFFNSCFICWSVDLFLPVFLAHSPTIPRLIRVLKIQLFEIVLISRGDRGKFTFRHRRLGGTWKCHLRVRSVDVQMPAQSWQESGSSLKSPLCTTNGYIRRNRWVTAHHHGWRQWWWQESVWQVWMSSHEWR